MDNVLTVKGERKADHDTAGKDYFVREVAYGAFERKFTLPEGVDAAQVEAKYPRGMLEVRVPAPQAATPRTIEVKAASSGRPGPRPCRCRPARAPAFAHNDAQRPPIPFSYKSMALALIRAFREHATQPPPAS